MSKFLEWYKEHTGFDDIDDIEDASMEHHIAYIVHLEKDNAYRITRHTELYKEWEDAELACRAANVTIKARDNEIKRLERELGQFTHQLGE